MKQILLFTSIALASGLLIVNIYTSLIDARSWGSKIPQSISTAREYFKTVNPGDFFRKISPVNQLLALVLLILFWKAVPNTRLYLGAALIFYVLGDVMTFTYFYPRNEILFNSGSLDDVALLKKTWQEWTGMNWIRSLIILAGLICSCVGVHKIYLKNIIG